MGLSDVLRDAGLAGYAEVALVLFLLAFALIVWWVFRRKKARDWDRARQMPLEDDRVLMPRGEPRSEQGLEPLDENDAGPVAHGRQESQ